MTDSKAEVLLRAITTRDFPALEAALPHGVRFRALLPTLSVDETGPAAVADRFRGWFGNAESFEVQHATTHVTGDRPVLDYRFRVRKPGAAETVISQHLVLIGDNGSVDALHLVCSGFRPASGTSSSEAEDFDAGTLGCADGLTEAFKARIANTALGARLRVHTTDPSAKEDLPSLARLMGHKVHSTETHPDGSLTITVERGR